MDFRCAPALLAAAALSGLLACTASPKAPPGPAAPETADKTTPAGQAGTARVASLDGTPNPYPGTTRRQTRHGETLYCWQEAQTGRRIPRQNCATEQVMRERAEVARQLLEDMRDPATRGGCNPGQGCN